VGNVDITQKGSVRLMGCVPREKKEPNHQKTNFPRRSTRGGGITLLGGRTIWGRGEEWRGINEGRGVERHCDEAKR
jgi:hypothetical protein